MNEALSWILDVVQSVDPVLRTLLAGLAILLETSVLVGLIVPGDTVVIVASTAVDGPVQYFGLIVAVVVGALCGESIGFALGRWFGPKIRDGRLGRRIGTRHWDRAARYLARRGGLAVFVSRFLPVLHSLIPLTVGMSSMSYRRFMAWTTPACLIWAFLYVSVGSAAAGGYRELSGEVHLAGYLFVAAIVAFVLVMILVKRLLGRLESRHMVEEREPAAAAEGAERSTQEDEGTPSGPR